MTMYNRYRERPPAKSKAARIAWDELQRRATDKDANLVIKMLWYAPEMQAWCAELSDEDFIEMDVLEVSDRRNNPHKYVD